VGVRGICWDARPVGSKVEFVCHMWCAVFSHLSLFLSWGLKIQPNHWTKRMAGNQLVT